MDCTVTVRVPADAQATWRRWTDVARWPDWNPVCVSAVAPSTLKEDDRLRLQLRHPGGRDFYTEPTVSALEPATVAEWQAKVGGLRAITRAEFEEEPGGTRITVTCSSHGPMGFAYRLAMRPRVQAAIYTEMLNALAGSFDHA